MERRDNFGTTRRPLSLRRASRIILPRRSAAQGTGAIRISAKLGQHDSFTSPYLISLVRARGWPMTNSHKHCQSSSPVRRGHLHRALATRRVNVKLGIRLHFFPASLAAASSNLLQRWPNNSSRAALSWLGLCARTDGRMDCIWKSTRQGRRGAACVRGTAFQLSPRARRTLKVATAKPLAARPEDSTVNCKSLRLLRCAPRAES